MVINVMPEKSVLSLVSDLHHSLLQHTQAPPFTRTPSTPCQRKRPNDQRGEIEKVRRNQKDL